MRFEDILAQYFNNFRSYIALRPLNLGGIEGSGGGIGGPPGGFAGYLPQTRSAYDYSEDATLFTPTISGSLLDNLNHIRYRITVLETSGAPMEVEWGGVVVASGITILDFEGAGVADVSAIGSKVTVTISGGGGGSPLDVENSGITIVSGATSIDFGTGFTVVASGLEAYVTYSGAAGQHAHVYGEDVSAQIVPSGYHFTTTYIYMVNTLRIYLNGLRQRKTYYYEDAGLQGFTVTFSADLNDELFVDYDLLVTPSGLLGWGLFGWGGGWGS
jgi:hypothetical protein